ncbi:hypothetical protein SprV_0902691900 [Sparganum proliferum]
MNRSRWTPSDPMCQQSDNVYFFSSSRPCRKPHTDRHLRHHRSHGRCPAAINHQHHPPYTNPCVNHNQSTALAKSRTPPPPGRLGGVRCPIIFYPHH